MAPLRAPLWYVSTMLMIIYRDFKSDGPSKQVVIVRNDGDTRGDVIMLVHGKLI